MKIFLFFCFFGCATLLFAQEEAELVKNVRAKLDRVNDYEAAGKMKIDVFFIDAPESKITVYYKKPDKFKVKKEGGISILPKGGISINLGSLLASQDYDIIPGKDAMVDGIQTKVVKLLPSAENSDIVLTTLYIDEKNRVVRKAAVTTKESGTYEIGFSYGRFMDWGLPDKVVFSFDTKDYKLPKGITFEYEKGEKKKDENHRNKKGKITIVYSAYTINQGIEDKVFEKE
jgi:outer membrane lipoprotein-sorting protein